MEKFRVSVLDQFAVKGFVGSLPGGRRSFQQSEKDHDVDFMVSRVADAMNQVELRLSKESEWNSEKLNDWKRSLRNSLTELDATHAEEEARLDEDIRSAELLVATLDINGQQSEKEQLQQTLHMSNQVISNKQHLNRLRLDIFEQECLLVNEQRKIEQVKEYMRVEFPKKRKQVSKTITQLRMQKLALETSINSLQRDFESIDDQMAELAQLAGIFIQAIYRGYRVRSTVSQFKTDEANLKLAGKLLCRKLALHIPLIRNLFLTKDNLEKALEPEMTCRFCYQPFEEPMWIACGTKKGETYCRSCCSQVLRVDETRVMQRRISQKSVIKTLHNSLLESIQERMAQRHLLYAQACRKMDEMRTELIIMDDYESLPTVGLQPVHLSERCMFSS